MRYESKQMEESALLQTAAAMCAAARTAPKTKGIDGIETLVLTGEEKEALARAMEAIAARDFGGNPACWFYRDAANLRAAGAVVLVGVRRACRGIPHCGLCGFADCAACQTAGGACAMAHLDLGIALSSAAAAAARCFVDNRIMYSAGKAAMEMGYARDVTWQGILISISGKNPFFDRK